MRAEIIVSEGWFSYSATQMDPRAVAISRLRLGLPGMMTLAVQQSGYLGPLGEMSVTIAHRRRSEGVDVEVNVYPPDIVGSGAARAEYRTRVWNHLIPPIGSLLVEQITRPTMRLRVAPVYAEAVAVISQDGQVVPGSASGFVVLPAN